MLSRTPPPPVVIIHPEYSCDDADLEDGRKPKRERRLRHTSPSPSRSRFLGMVRHNNDHEDVTDNGKQTQQNHHHGMMRFLDIIRRHGHDHDHEDATENGKRPPQHNGSGNGVKRCLSYHDIAAATALLGSGPGGGSDKDAQGRDAASMSNGPAVGHNSAVHLSVEEDHTRQRKSSGGSHHHLFSLGLRFGGRGKAEKKKKDKKGGGDLPSPGAQDPSFGDADLTLYSVPPETLREWRKSLDVVLQHSDGRVLFHRHLALEHSLENMQFCKAVDHFKTLPDNKLEKEARAIAAEFVGEGTPKALNIDSSVVKKVEAQLKSPHRDMFDEARQTAYELMAQDSFRRFKTSPDFVKASQRDQISTPPPSS